MKKYSTLLIIYFLTGLFMVSNAQRLVVYDTVPGRATSDHYVCRVKFESEANSAYREVVVLQTRGKEASEDPEDGYYDNIRGWTASWIAFESDFDGENVVVEISKKDGSPINEAMVRPVEDASPAVIIDGKAYVTFTEPANVNVDINGQMEKNYTGHGYNGPDVHTITLFANPIFKVPDPSNANVKVLQPGEDIDLLNRSEWDTLVFAPGVHNLGVDSASGTVVPFQILTNEVLYIPGDAVVHGTIHPKDAWGDEASRFWTVYGSGTISGENIRRIPSEKGRETKPFTYQAEGVHLEGFVVVDPAFHTFNMNNSRDDGVNLNIYKNLKILAWRVNSDGVNAFRHSEVSDCFFRVQDDAFYLGNKNVNQHDNVVWNDSNGAVLFLQNIADGSTNVFRDVRVIYHRAYWHWWSGGRIVSMRERESNITISNVHVKDITVTDPLPAFPPFYATMLADAENVTLNNIVFENIRQEHDGVTTSSDATRGKPQNTMLGQPSAIWENITFKNCNFNGQTLTSFADGNFDTAYVDENTVIFETVSDAPVADFTASTNSVAKGESVTFTDLSENNPTAWAWTFEGGTPGNSNEENPNVTYNAPGVFQVSLVATNSFGSDTVRKEEFISVTDSIMVTGVSITNCPTENQAIGETLQLIHTISPDSATDKRVIWTSSDESVLRVAENGVLTPVSAGTAIVTATTRNGGFTDNCEVTVVAVDEITDISAPFQVVPGETITVEVEYIASQRRDLYVAFQLVSDPFTEFGSNRITVPAGEQTRALAINISPSAPPGINDYQITAGILPVGGDWSDRLDQVSFKDMDIYPPTSLEPSMDLLKLYPNPAEDLLRIEFGKSGSKKIRIFNIIGEIIYQDETSDAKADINLNALNASGQVLVQIHLENTIINRKIIIR